MRKNNKKGFTLAELLIVVAIIAVLVAIAIPIFTAQLEKSRESTDVANARDYYAEISACLLDGSLNATDNTMTISGGLNVTATFNATTKKLESVTVAGVTINQKEADWAIGDFKVAGVAVTAPTAAMITAGTADITYTYTVTAQNTYLTSVAYA